MPNTIRRLVPFVLVVAAASACDRQLPTTPTATPAGPNAPAPPSRQSLHVVGFVVDDEDGHVPGASLTFYALPRVTMTTSADGAYDVTVSIDSGSQPSTWVTVEKPGYEPSELGVDASPTITTSRNLRLRAIGTIRAGESRHVVVSAGDSACGFHYGLVCRRVRVTSSQRGTLALQARSDDGQFGVFTGDALRATQEPLPSDLSMSIGANTEVIVNLAASSIDGGKDVTLDTTFTPGP